MVPSTNHAADVENTSPVLAAYDLRLVLLTYEMSRNFFSHICTTALLHYHEHDHLRAFTRR